VDKNQYIESKSDKIRCRVCGTFIDPDSKYCNYCGNRVIARSWREILGSAVVGIIALQALALIVFPSLLFSLMLIYNPITHQEMYIVTITALAFLNFFEIILFFPIYWHFNNLDATLKWTGLACTEKDKIVREVIVGLILGVLLAIFMENIAVLFLGEAAYSFQIPLEILFLLAISTIIIGFSEEILFRGFIQQSLDIKFDNKILAIIIASIIFGLAHLRWPTILITATLGVIIGILYELFERRLFAPITLHAVYDFMIFAYPLFNYLFFH